jgi:Na+/melibiose symporter-like transporter
MSALIAWGKRHPYLAGWIVLAVGMVALLIWEARDVGLQPGQWAALIVATILVAGACIWIISWDSDEEASPAGNEAAPPAADASGKDAPSG